MIFRAHVTLRRTWDIIYDNDFVSQGFVGFNQMSLDFVFIKNYNNVIIF